MLTGNDGTRTLCHTCRRYRPSGEFVMPDPANVMRSYLVNICGSCREKLWDDPGNPYEGR